MGSTIGGGTQAELTKEQWEALEHVISVVNYDIRRAEQALSYEVGREYATPRKDRRQRMLKERDKLATLYCHREALRGMINLPHDSINIHNSLLRAGIDGIDLYPVWLARQDERDRGQTNEGG